jgi:hypothetical protein
VFTFIAGFIKHVCAMVSVSARTQFMGYTFKKH